MTRPASRPQRFRFLTIFLSADRSASHPASEIVCDHRTVISGRSIGAVGLTAFGVGVFYFVWLREPLLTWGATDAEAASTLPGDELLSDSDGSSTRAITIEAPPSAVWPWLAQMGPSPRGGVYTYDWIENLLGLDIHSVDHVMPEYQHPEEGDEIALGSNTMRIELVGPGQTFAFRSGDGNWLWSFNLIPDGDSTRLISRNRFRLPTLGAKIGILPMEPGSLIMERKMLLGIKERAEALVTQADNRPRT